MRFNAHLTRKEDPRRLPSEFRRSLTKAIAWIAIRSACRHVPALWGRSDPVLLGLVVSAGSEASYASVLDSVMYSGAAQTQVLTADKAKRGLDAAFADALADDDVSRIAVVVSDAALLPEHFDVLADAVVNVPAASGRHLTAAVRHVLRMHVGDDDAAHLVTHDLHLVEVMLRKTKSPAKAVAALRRLAAAEARPARPRHLEPRLEDLHGYGEAKAWGLDLARDLADWRAGALPWADVDRGVLLSGPPGVGKTVFASALARTCDAHLVLGSIGRWQSKGYLNDMLKAMRGAFDEARAKAPSIMFIDEIDAVGDRQKFDDHNADYSTQVVAALLECMDGAEGREGVVVVGTANHPDRLDPAIRRPGRLDRHIAIPLPDAPARTGILRHHLSGTLAGEELSLVVGMTDGWSGAGLEQLVRQARRLARRHRRDLTVGDLLECLPPRVPVPREARWRIAVHEAGHAVVGLTEEHGRLVSVEVSRMRNPTPEGPRMRAQATWELDDSARITSRREDYLRNISVTLGGIAAERIVFGAASDGAGGGEDSDLATATRLAAAVEGSLGLGGSLTHLADLDHVQLLATRDYPVRQRVEATLQECLRRAEKIVDERKEDVLAVAQAVMERERITGEEVLEITSRQPRLRLVPGG